MMKQPESLHHYPGGEAGLSLLTCNSHSSKFLHVNSPIYKIQTFVSLKCPQLPSYHRSMRLMQLRRT